MPLDFFVMVTPLLKVQKNGQNLHMLAIEGRVKIWTVQWYVAEITLGEDRDVACSSNCSALHYPKINFWDPSGSYPSGR